MKEKKLTKDYLKKQGWRFYGIFGTDTDLEMWIKKSQMMLVDKNTRKQEVTSIQVEDKNGG